MFTTDNVPAQATGLLTISPAAVVANWQFLRAKVGAGCAVSAVVKAQAYGLGAAPITRALLAAGCRRFFLANIDEGIELRQALGARSDVTLAILAGPPERGAGLLLEHGLVPVLNDPAQIALWRRAAPGKPSILNIDTGMARLGLSSRDVALLAADSTSFEGLNPILVMSHLACADEPEHPLNEMQRQRFAALAARLPPAPWSLAASSGIFLGSPYHYGMVRPGAALYGLNPTPGNPNPMREVVGLKAKIIQLQEIDAGRTVGYGATHIARRASRLAILGVGYADGCLRSAGNVASFRVGTHRVPVVGRISMDLITVDVTELPADELRPGGWVDVIGPDYTVDHIAQDSGTIGYEILTRLSQRLHRVYLS